MDGRRRLRDFRYARSAEGGGLRLLHGLALRRPADLDEDALRADPFGALPGRGQRFARGRAPQAQRPRILRHAGRSVRRNDRAVRKAPPRVQHLDPPLRFRPAVQVAAAAHRAQALRRAQAPRSRVVDAAGRNRRLLFLPAAGNHPRRLGHAWLGIEKRSNSSRRSPMRGRIRFSQLLVLAALLAGCGAQAAAPGREDLAKIENIVVIYAENHSFDNLYGLFPGANGVARATAEQKIQLDHDGKPLPHLPPVYTQGKPDPRFPQNLPNGPFRIDAPPVNARTDQIVPSPIHNYYQNIEQINGGKNNLFVAMTTVGAWAMGYYDGSSMRLWRWAKGYVLTDNFFMAAFGGSFLNHQWLVCACTPVDS